MGRLGWSLWSRAVWVALALGGCEASDAVAQDEGAEAVPCEADDCAAGELCVQPKDHCVCDENNDFCDRQPLPRACEPVPDACEGLDRDERLDCIREARCPAGEWEGAVLDCSADHVGCIGNCDFEPWW
jgi:hypothetical protein